jgi:RND family efflux transporter MFP subunit
MLNAPFFSERSSNMPSLPRHLTAAAAVLLLAACGADQRAALPQKGTAEVGVRAVKPRSATGALATLTGELRAKSEAVLSADVTGRIERLRVDVGDRVKKGDVLVEIDGAQARIGLQQARAARAMAAAGLRSAESDLGRTRQLAAGDAVSAAGAERAEIAVEQARAALQQADAAVAAAEESVRRHAMRAPFDGVVTARLKSAGETVSAVPPTAVVALVAVDALEVRVAVPETVVDLVSMGQVLSCKVSPSGRTFEAKVRAVGASVDAATRTVDVRADVAGRTFRELRPGSLVEIALGAGAGAGAGLFIPSDTVRESGAERFVWAVAEGVARRRTVRVERAGPGLFRVLDGVGADDLVVSETGAVLEDGAPVRVLQ